jgi:hypothetical protein
MRVRLAEAVATAGLLLASVDLFERTRHMEDDLAFSIESIFQ